jgi:hypothetical protein
MAGVRIPIDRNSAYGLVGYHTPKRSHLKLAITSNQNRSPLRKAKETGRRSRMNTKQAAIGRWAEIYKYFGLPGITGKNHFKGECPMWSKGKFRCDNKNGTGSYLCMWPGDGWALLTAKRAKNLRFCLGNGQADRQ